MSLALFRDRIEAGEVDETVRTHLRGCDECRAHYDRLQRAARALGDDGALAERERLMRALPAESKPRRLTWLAAVAATFLAVVTLLVLRQPADTQMRGTNDGSAPPFSLRVYGKDGPGEKLHLIADFPGSKEATVSLRAELQYFVKPPPKSGEVVLVESRSALKLLAARSEPADDLSPAGSAFSVGAFGPGEIEVCAVLTSNTTQSLADAIKAGATKHCSTLLVTP